jgi:hypothetical protein
MKDGDEDGDDFERDDAGRPLLSQNISQSQRKKAKRLIRIQNSEARLLEEDQMTDTILKSILKDGYDSSKVKVFKRAVGLCFVIDCLRNK